VKATERLIDVAAAVSDGAVVDWRRTESAAPSAERHLVGHLRLLERVASVHAALPPLAAFERSLHESLSHPAAVIDMSRGDVPATWGPLTIIERIGSGTYADVFRAREPRLDRFVALKLLRHRDDGGTAVDSEAIEEARLLARIHQPNVVTVHGAERVEGRVGIWMELVDGETLEQELRDRGPFAALDLIDVGTALCRALGAVHAAGLLHRDVKAQNVMRGRDGRVLLTDFGTGRELTDMSAARELAGTPLYLAPEVLNGQPASVASDIYSLGVLLYHLATGSFPIAGRSLRDLRDAHARGARVPLQALRSDLSCPIASAIDHACAPDPSGRYSSLAAFNGALNGAPVWRGARRRRRLAAIALAITLASVGAVYVLRHRSIASAPDSKHVTAEQLTFNPPERFAMAAVIASGGRNLAYVDSTGLILKNLQTSQENRIVLPPAAAIDNLSWVPNSTRLLAAGPNGIWETSTLGEALRVFTRHGGRIAVSWDGEYVALTDEGGDRIRLFTPTGEETREIAAPQPGVTFSRAIWSPDSRRVAYRTAHTNPTGLGFSVTIETRLLDGTGQTQLVSGPGIQPLGWTLDGRVLFAKNLPAPEGRYSDLWAIRVDTVTGQPAGVAERLWQAPGFTFAQSSLTRDGSQLVFVRNRYEAKLYDAEFDPQRVELKGLTAIADSDGNSLSAWTPRGDALLVLGYPSPSFMPHVYKWDPYQGTRQPVLLSPSGAAIPQAILSPDEAWMFYFVGGGDKRFDLIRVPAAGGTAEHLLTALGEKSWIRCSGRAANVCLMGTLSDGHLRVRGVRPAEGKPASVIVLPESPTEGSWDLSPDGTEVVSVDATHPTSRLVLADLRSGRRRVLSGESWTRFQFVTWCADGAGWIVTRGAGVQGGEVLYIDRDGRSRVLWKSGIQHLIVPMMSPDGRHIAFSSFLVENAVWRVEGF